ncbi:MAG: toprim domain-containing protein [Candidatus Baldrarchaeia archaeon]
MAKIIDDEKLLKLFDALRESSEKGIPIIVEGKRDEDALRSIGICGQIIKVAGQGPLKVVDSMISSGRIPSSVIILTDLDRKGDLLASMLDDLLRSYGIVPINEFRYELRKIVGGRIKGIEELTYLLEFIERNSRRRYDE